MGIVNLPIGASNSGSNDWSDVHGEDQAIVDQVNGNLNSSNLAAGAALANLASASVTDAKLESPNTGLYKDIGNWGSTAIGPDVLGSSTGYLNGSTFTASFLPGLGGAGLTLDSTFYSVPGKTPSLRLVCSVFSNATAIGINLTFGLYLFTVAGGVDAFVYTAGSIVVGSSTAINTPPALTVTTAVTSSAFTFPSAGLYIVGVSLSGTQANNNKVEVAARLQVHHT